MGAAGTSAARSRLRTHATAAGARWALPALAGLLVVHILLGFTVRTPSIYPDELEYWLLAHQLAAGRLSFTWQGAPFDFPAMLYPLLIAPLSVLPPAAMYDAVKVLNCLVMTSAAIPVYLLARRVGADRDRALWAAVLSTALPAFIYGAHVMAEPLYYPLFAWTAYGTVRVFGGDEMPPAWTSALWGLLAGGLELVKPQGLLAPALFLGALLWRLAVRRRRGGGMSMAAGIAGVAAGLGLRLAYMSLSGADLLPLSVAKYLGYYTSGEALAQPGADVLHLLPVALLYVAVLAVAVGVVPLAVLVAPATLRSVRREPALQLTWLLCLAAALLLIVAFSRNTLLRNVLPAGELSGLGGLRLQERYLFPVSGLILALWARTGSPSRPATAAALGLAGAGCILALGPHLAVSVFEDAPSLAGFEGLRLLAPAWLGLAPWAAAVACFGIAVAVAARRPALVLGILLVLSAGAFAATWNVSRAGRETSAYLPAALMVARTVPAGAPLAFDRRLPASLTMAIEFWHPAAWILVSPGQGGQPLPGAYRIAPADAALTPAPIASDALVAVVP